MVGLSVGIATRLATSFGLAACGEPEVSIGPPVGIEPVAPPPPDPPAAEPGAPPRRGADGDQRSADEAEGLGRAQAEVARS